MSQPAPPEQSASAPSGSGLQQIAPIAVLLLAQVALYLWLAPRAFEFTDEAYYLLNYLHWREFSALNSFFGAYFEWPFRLLGGSIPGLRVLSLVLLLVSAAVFSLAVCRHIALGQPRGTATSAFVLTGSAAALSYFGILSTLRLPSYNLLALCAMLVATALLLEALRDGISPRRRRALIFAYGLAVGACGLGKASSAALLVLVHGAFFAFANRDWRAPRLLEVVILTMAGVALNFAFIHVQRPDWFPALREGVVMFNLTDGRSMIGLAHALRWEIQSLPKLLLVVAPLALALVFAVSRWARRSRPEALSPMIVGLVALSLAGLMLEDLARLWLPLFALLIVLLWGIDVANRTPARTTRGDAREWGLTLMLLALPFAVSFGTNNPVLEHTRMAAVFVLVAALVRLFALAGSGLLTGPGLTACLACLCLPPLATQVSLVLDARSAYRQTVALGEQSEPLSLRGGETRILVDGGTRRTLDSVVQAGRAVGLAEGQKVLDFTGDSPGLVYALNARPLGVAWLFGGYPGSEAAATRLISELDPESIRGAWLISSEASPRAISGWQQMLAARLGPTSHERVATVQIAAPYRWGPNPPPTLDIQLWRPASRRP